MNQIKERDVIIGQVLNISQTTQLKGKKIVLDPGHGGIETGAEHNGLIEKDETLEVSLKTKRLLEAEGAQVILTLDENTNNFHDLFKSDYAIWLRQTCRRNGKSYRRNIDFRYSIWVSRKL